MRTLRATFKSIIYIYIYIYVLLVEKSKATEQKSELDQDKLSIPIKSGHYTNSPMHSHSSNEPLKHVQLEEKQRHSKDHSVEFSSVNNTSPATDSGITHLLGQYLDRNLKKACNTFFFENIITYVHNR